MRTANTVTVVMSIEGPDSLRVFTRQRAARLGSTRVDILVIDEAHRLGLAGIQYPALLKGVQARMIIGLTATPWRTSIGGIEDSSVDTLFPDDNEHRCVPITLAEAVDPAGGPVLAQLFRYVVDTGLTMELTEEETSFRVTDGNRTFAQFLTPQAVRLVAATWFGGLGKTLVFALTKQHADALTLELRAQHPEATVLVVHSDLDECESEAALTEFRRAKEDDHVILVSVAMLLEGVDFPNATTVVMARPTRSTLLYVQMLGRVLRGPRMGGTQRAFAVEFFVRTRSDEHATAKRVRGTVFRQALLAPSKQRTGNARSWDPAEEWGAELELPPDVAQRVEHARRALPHRSGDVAADGFHLAGGPARVPAHRRNERVRITRQTLEDMYYDWHPGFKRVAMLTNISETTLKQYLRDGDRFEAWRNNKIDVMDDVRDVIADFRSRRDG